MHLTITKYKYQNIKYFTLGKSVQRLVDITQPSKDLASVIRSSKVLKVHTLLHYHLVAEILLFSVIHCSVQCPPLH
jgi:hypothetical protein